MDEKEKPSYSGFFRRLFSFVIDIVGLSFIVFLFDYTLYTQITIGKIINNPLTYFIGIIFFIPYFSFMECSKRQGTFGKIITGLIVSDIYGHRISFKKSFTRTIIKSVHIFLVIIIIGLIFGMMEIGMIDRRIMDLINLLPLSSLFISVLITKKKQSIHDMIVKTVVS